MTQLIILTVLWTALPLMLWATLLRSSAWPARWTWAVLFGAVAVALTALSLSRLAAPAPSVTVSGPDGDITYTVVREIGTALGLAILYGLSALIHAGLAWRKWPVPALLPGLQFWVLHMGLGLSLLPQALLPLVMPRHVSDYAGTLKLLHWLDLAAAALSTLGLLLFVLLIAIAARRRWLGPTPV